MTTVQTNAPSQALLDTMNGTKKRTALASQMCKIAS